MLGIAFPFQFSPILGKSKKTTKGSSEKILIVGAGAAGLSAGYLLQQRGIEFQILEATSSVGGRMKKTDDFTDFPIPLGAEWLTDSVHVFDSIVNDPSVTVNVKTKGYKRNDVYGVWNNKKLQLRKLGAFHYRKFINGTWLNFFETYILPSVSANIVYNSVVSSINYESKKVIVTTQTEGYKADKVILTVPLKIIQNDDIKFMPALPEYKLDAINKATVWDGIKVFFTFSEKFYPTYTDYKITPKESGQVSYFDAAYGQNTDKHVLGLFAVGAPSQPYLKRKGDPLKDYILNELDRIFSNKATPHYVNHIVQNWTEEPFINGAYLNDYADWKTVNALFQPVAGKLFFAGEAYTLGNDWGTVHSAAQAAKETIEKMVI